MSTLPRGLKVSISNTPQAGDDAFAFIEDVDGGILSLDVLANDLGGEAKNLYSLHAGPPPADLSSLLTGAPTPSIVSPLTDATVSIDADGTIHYDTTGLDFQHLGAGESLVETFTYVIRLANGAFSVAAVTVTIDGENDAPSSTNDNLTIAEDATVLLSLSDFGTYADVDSDPHATIMIAALPAEGVLQYDTTGTGTWAAVAQDQVISAADIAAGKLRFMPDVNESGSPYATIGFRVGDGLAFSASPYTLTLNVTAVDDGDATVTITGTAQEDSILTANFGNDDPDGAASGVTYQWQRNGVDIAGATGSTYTLGDADVGAGISVKVSYTDAQGFAETIVSAATSTVTALDDGDASVTITGTAQEDSVLTANFGNDDPDGAASGVTHQWQRDGVDIAGATGSTYTLGDADVGAAITVKVNYTDGQGFAETIVSAATSTVTALDDGDASVTITGTAQEDSVLTANFGNDDPDGAASGVTYQWQRDGVDIAGATGSTYTLGDADVGAGISVKVSYTDAQGFAETIVSAATSAVTAFDDGDASVTITGTAQEDSVLTANFGNDDPDGAASGVTYQWQRNGVDIAGAMGSTYTPGDADVGAAITVKVNYTDGQGFVETVESPATATVTPFDDGDATVTITGTAQQNALLTANFGNNDPDGAASGVTYQWQRNGTDITGAMASTYTLVAADVGATITVEVDYTDGQGFAEVIESAPTAPVAPDADVNDAPVLDTTASPMLTPINEDAPVPAGAVGTLVSALVDFNPPATGNNNVTDPDLGALTGIAITAVGGNGTWSYSLNNGATWLLVGTVSAASALLLAADANTRLYFRPNANFDGDSTITFRAWDQTSGAAGTKVDTTINGGTTAFSTATDTATIDVTPVNDAPSAASDLVASINAVTTVVVPEWALLRNDSDIDSPATLDLGILVANTGGTATHSAGGVGTGFISFADVTPVGGTFQYQATDGALLSGVSTVTVGPVHVSTAPNGSGGWNVFASPTNQLSIVVGTAGPDTLFDNISSGILIGGTGGDILLGTAGNDWYGFNLGDSGGVGVGGFNGDIISESGSSSGQPAGVDRIVINAIAGPALSSLNFERVPDGDATSGDALQITYNGQLIRALNHFNPAFGAIEQMQFLGGASFLGYALGTGVYNIVADFFSPTTGTGGNDVIASSSVVITGTPGPAELLQGFGGNDLMFGNGANDTLIGGTGNDLMVGGAGNDRYDFAFTGDGIDTVSEAGGGTDAITIAVGGAAMTALNFERVGANLVLTYNGQQVTAVNHYAGAGVETITFTGGGTFLGYSLGAAAYALSTDSATPLDGGAGLDVIASSALGEALNGGAGNDLLFGNGAADSISGGGGNDLIIGGTGNDSMNGGAGDDVMDAGGDADFDSFFFGAVTGVSDTVSNGTDSIVNFDAVGGSGAQDFIFLDALFDSLGRSDADRAAGAGYIVDAATARLLIDLDNDNATGVLGGFEYVLATVSAVTGGTFDNADVNAGTL